MDVLLRVDAGMPSAQIDALATRAASAGVSGVVLTFDGSGEIDGMSLMRTCEWITAAGLEVDAVHAKEFPLAAADAVARRAASEGIVRLISAAAQVQAHRVVVAIAACEENVRADDAYAHVVEALSALRFDAETRAIELVCPCPIGRLWRSPVETRDFFDHVTSPWAVAALDVSQLSTSADAVDWVVTLGRRLRWVLVPSMKDAEACAPRIEWTAIFSALRAARCDALFVCDDLDTAAALPRG